MPKDTARNDPLAALRERIASRQATVGIYGLGYVGLPLALRNDLNPLTLWHRSDADGTELDGEGTGTHGSTPWGWARAIPGRLVAGSTEPRFGLD